MRKHLSSTWREALGVGLAPDATSRRTKVLATRRGFFATSARDPRTMAPYDASLSWSALLLLAIGVVMVYSASIAMAEASGHTGHRAWYFLARHAMFIAVGLVSAGIGVQKTGGCWHRVWPC